MVEPRPFNIESFERIGMIDPFSNEQANLIRCHTLTSGTKSKKINDINDLVYHNCRYVKGESPKCIWIPSA